eukprot:CAMPEP_0118926052 /NCGR_PEP_ID=MMETSP1169-20130426/3838_1 /TAXON_ID=36882 /ORGANISM="Pyramimonas obovata, Strain CCMP722" /LENGTH=118 /DNA_ID=CAMNT_0006867519 /DNA_START=206 /DNA_END=559 /DNA_ORIENTATION=+
MHALSSPQQWLRVGVVADTHTHMCVCALPSLQQELRLGGGHGAVVVEEEEEVPAEGPHVHVPRGPLRLQPLLQRLKQPVREPHHRVLLPLDRVQLLQVVALQQLDGKLGRLHEKVEAQ